ncbi:uncharacterized protein LOC111941918, partial [Cyanistes caeruleus]|uniref:uncharacterized protein LOC111941918 n=1 Tax=Cyanistes caeruleus TaxID=156563 RepID=UPI000CDB7371
ELVSWPVYHSGTRKSIGAPGGVTWRTGTGNPQTEAGEGARLSSSPSQPGVSGVPSLLRARWGGHGGDVRSRPESPPSPSCLPAVHWPPVPCRFTHFLDYNSRSTAGPHGTPLAPGLRFPSCPVVPESPSEPLLSPKYRPSCSASACLNRGLQSSFGGLLAKASPLPYCPLDNLSGLQGNLCSGTCSFSFLTWGAAQGGGTTAVKGTWDQRRHQQSKKYFPSCSSFSTHSTLSMELQTGDQLLALQQDICPCLTWLMCGMWFISCKATSSSRPCKDFHRGWLWCLHSVPPSIPSPSAGVCGWGVILE